MDDLVLSFHYFKYIQKTLHNVLGKACRVNATSLASPKPSSGSQKKKGEASARTDVFADGVQQINHSEFPVSAASQ
jgi:hypothetical protein